MFCCMSLTCSLPWRVTRLSEKASCLAYCQHIQLGLYFSFTPMLRSCSGPSCSFSHWGTRRHYVDWTFNHHKMFECAHLKFMVSSRSKQTSQQAYTHACAMQSRWCGARSGSPQSKMLYMDKEVILLPKRMIGLAYVELLLGAANVWEASDDTYAESGPLPPLVSYPDWNRWSFFTRTAFHNVLPKLVALVYFGGSYTVS